MWLGVRTSSFVGFAFLFLDAACWEKIRSISVFFLVNILFQVFCFSNQILTHIPKYCCCSFFHSAGYKIPHHCDVISSWDQLASQRLQFGRNHGLLLAWVQKTLQFLNPDMLGLWTLLGALCHPNFVGWCALHNISLWFATVIAC